MSNSHDREVYPEVPIFPLLSFNPENGIWRCLGTGFFIHPLGGFVTAKHVFFDNEGKHVPTLYAIQTTEVKERHIRILKDFVIHPKADIAVGFLGNRRLLNGSNVKPEVAACFRLDPNPLLEGETVHSYAFPNTERVLLGDGKFEFTFQGVWSQGIIVECHNEGFSQIKNKCYQTTMKIESGASGGPVIRNNSVIGINSTSFDTAPGEEPISFITPIELIFNLEVPINDGLFTIRELITKGHLLTK